MERLTKRRENGSVRIAWKCPEYCEHSTCSMEEGYQCKHECEGDIIEKLADYEDAEEQGLLLRLPCKVGSTVYLIKSDRKIVPRTADIMFLGVLWDEYGKEWFLTKEEAEQALKQMGE